MAYWRMKMRNGLGGEDMWPSCRDRSVAAMDYEAIRNLDLSIYSRSDNPPGWKQLKGAEKGNIRKFAWDIRGGDTIYVADSKERQIVGKGHATCLSGERAYRFDRNSPIAVSGDKWPHLIDMDWDADFTAFEYQDRAPMITVLALNQDEIEGFEAQAPRNEYLQPGLTAEDRRTGLLLETVYSRYTPAARRTILRKHVALSNQFTAWLQNTRGIRATQEFQRIDARFEIGGKRFLVEFKVAYLGDTKRAIREALGQILEYNYYPPRVSHDHWLLVLDTAPRDEDRAFLGLLRGGFSLPLSLGWSTSGSFDFEPHLEF
jgi:hypothetical protein